jgi:hypothetical protein
LATKDDNALSHTSFFTRGFFTKNNMTVIPQPPYFSVFPIEVIETESQAVLNTLSEWDFKDAFKK